MASGRFGALDRHHIDQLREFGPSLVIGTLAAGPMLAFAQATGVEAEIDSAKTEILALIAKWGAAFILVALAGVGWRVGAKLIKRMAGAA